MAMGIFNRRKEDGSPADPQVSGAPAATVQAARDPDIGVPPFRPATKEAPMMTSAPKPNAAPAAPSVSGPRPAPIATSPGWV